ncbi:hypothetical protein ACJX0J_034164, partial [Zea mays]
FLIKRRYDGLLANLGLIIFGMLHILNTIHPSNYTNPILHHGTKENVRPLYIHIT